MQAQKEDSFEAFDDANVDSVFGFATTGPNLRTAVPSQQSEKPVDECLQKCIEADILKQNYLRRKSQPFMSLTGHRGNETMRNKPVDPKEKGPLDPPQTPSQCQIPRHQDTNRGPEVNIEKRTTLPQTPATAVSCNSVPQNVAPVIRPSVFPQNIRVIRSVPKTVTSLTHRLNIPRNVIPRVTLPAIQNVTPSRQPQSNRITPQILPQANSNLNGTRAGAFMDLENAAKIKRLEKEAELSRISANIPSYVSPRVIHPSEHVTPPRQPQVPSNFTTPQQENTSPDSVLKDLETAAEIKRLEKQAEVARIREKHRQNIAPRVIPPAPQNVTAPPNHPPTPTRRVTPQIPHQVNLNVTHDDAMMDLETAAEIKRLEKEAEMLRKRGREAAAASAAAALSAGMSMGAPTITTTISNVRPLTMQHLSNGNQSQGVNSAEEVQFIKTVHKPRTAKGLRNEHFTLRNPVTNEEVPLMTLEDMVEEMKKEQGEVEPSSLPRPDQEPYEWLYQAARRDRIESLAAYENKTHPQICEPELPPGPPNTQVEEPLIDIPESVEAVVHPTLGYLIPTNFHILLDEEMEKAPKDIKDYRTNWALNYARKIGYKAAMEDMKALRARGQQQSDDSELMDVTPNNESNIFDDLFRAKGNTSIPSFRRTAGPTVKDVGAGSQKVPQRRFKYTAADDREIIDHVKKIRATFGYLPNTELCRRLIHEYRIKRTHSSLLKHYNLKLQTTVQIEEERERERSRILNNARSIPSIQNPPHEAEKSDNDDEDHKDVYAIEGAEEYYSDYDPYFEDACGYSYN